MLINTIVEVKSNVGNRTEKVRIFSHEVIDDSIIKFLQEMTFDEVQKYGDNKGWKVYRLEN